MSRMMPGRHSGFTLIELVVAMSVFAVMSVMAFAGLRSVLTAQEVVERNAELLGQIQLATGALERDIAQSVQRPVRDTLGGPIPVLFGSPTALELTRTAWRNPLAHQRSTLQRVRFGWDGSVLTRTYWQVLDRSQGSRPAIWPLLENVEDFRLRYRDARGDWVSQWPPGADRDAWPVAVEFYLSIQGFGIVHRIVPLAVADAVIAEGPGR